MSTALAGRFPKGDAAHCRHRLAGRCSVVGEVAACPLNGWRPCRPRPASAPPRQRQAFKLPSHDRTGRPCPGVGNAGCGVPLDKRRRLCDTCRVEARRKTKREAQAKWRTKDAENGRM
jgi:hypothetical protein